jgi:hypothetical protein
METPYNFAGILDHNRSLLATVIRVQFICLEEYFTNFFLVPSARSVLILSDILAFLMHVALSCDGVAENIFKTPCFATNTPTLLPVFTWVVICLILNEMPSHPCLTRMSTDMWCRVKLRTCERAPIRAYPIQTIACTVTGLLVPPREQHNPGLIDRKTMSSWAWFHWQAWYRSRNDRSSDLYTQTWETRLAELRGAINSLWSWRQRLPPFHKIIKNLKQTPEKLRSEIISSCHLIPVEHGLKWMASSKKS